MSLERDSALVTHGSHDAANRPPVSRRSLVLGASGVVIEWYDFALYLYMAPLLGKLFTPASDPRVALLQFYGLYASGYLVRPLGALFYGSLGDRLGRKQALITSAVLMALCKLGEGLLPTYAQVGLPATAGLLILRMLSGFSMGGEYAGTFVYLLETAPHGRRGATTALANLMCASGIFLASLVVALTNLLGTSLVEAGGWRVPFFVGAAAGLLAMLMRTQMHESPSFAELQQTRDTAPSPVREALGQHGRAVVRCALLAACIAVSYHVLVAFVPTYLSRFGGHENSTALWISTLALLFLVAIVWLPGAWSDRIGRRRVLLFASLALALGAVPAFWALHLGSFEGGLGGACLAALLAALINAPAATMAVEGFPARVRCAGFSLGFNLGSVMGGLAPAGATLAIQKAGTPLAPAGLLLLVAFVLALVSWSSPETSLQSLHDPNQEAPSVFSTPCPHQSGKETS